jgi:DNA helicase-2/ATP-dependent DNA helicase PcrA
MSIFEGLNPQQKEAVEYIESPLLVIAGAGSGKTKVITHKVAYLITKGFEPESILALTFTNKAADEMKRRISFLVDRDFKDLWIMTFHSFSARVLRMFGKIIGISPDFSIIDREDQKNILKEILIRHELELGRAFVNSFVEKMGYTKSSITFYPSEEFLYQRWFREKEVELFNLYHKELKKLNCLDFDDLILKCIELLKNPESEKLRFRFKYILIDEFQDTSPPQYEIVKLLSFEGITAVGDEDQSIYSWRGANLENILRFEEDFPEAKIIKLEENYRSTKFILMGAQEVIVKNSRRREKYLFTNNPHGEPIIYYIAKNPVEEAKFIANEIKKIKEEERELFPVAIFYRVNQQSRNIEEALNALRISYKLIGGIKFYERKEIKDVIALLKIILNRDDDFSFKRVLSEIVGGISRKSIQKIVEISEKERIPINLATKIFIEQASKPAIEEVQNLFKKLDEWEEDSKLMKPSELVFSIVKELSIKEIYEEERMENLEELVKGISEMEKTFPEITLRDVVDNLSLRTDSDLEEHPMVNLMTLHISKGLEFPTVFIAGVDEDILPHRKSLSNHDIEEERRLFYVGMTRAKKRLYLTSGGNPSRFLKEIPEHLKTTGGSQRLEGDGEFVIGDFVHHESFGVGKVLNVREDGAEQILTIKFEDGIKAITSKYPKIRKITGDGESQ